MPFAGKVAAHVDANIALGNPIEAPPDDASAGQYRPHLDGLRAVAVYLVVLFHSGIGGFSGGYVGVDVFFVLSGFLVTQLLLRDLVAGGSIRLGRFYSRRFRRLLPAAFVALVVTAVVFTAISSPLEAANAVGSFKAAFLYSANWFFVHQATNYFGANLTSSPVLHFWSLAVEEQFYLVWPLLLGAVFAITRRRDRARQLRTIRIVVAVAAFASVALALSLRTSNPGHAVLRNRCPGLRIVRGGAPALRARTHSAPPVARQSGCRWRPTSAPPHCCSSRRHGSASTRSCAGSR